MCGIAGVLYRDPTRVPQGCVLDGMGTAIAHRGPDAHGDYSSRGVGLVHRRLSIIDLAGSQQPLSNEDESIHVVFNGEIYNFPQLRRDLIARGHVFRTEGDTEVLVHLYEEYGAELVKHLRGMFAFAIWDEPKRHLLLGRDRVGQKPLFYYHDNEKFVFGSELKAILAHPQINREIDPAAIASYLTLGFIPGNQCIFSQARKLHSASVLKFDSHDWKARTVQYWDLEFTTDESKSESSWLEHVDAKLQETIKVHRIADVPVGAFLSGGLDSSAIVSYVAAEEQGLHTFSIGFDEREFSELPFARQVAEHFRTRHFEQIVKADAVGGLDELVQHYDEPFADPSAIPTLAVARMASQYVKVVLSGDGGDEAFGGYQRYLHDLRESRFRQRIPRFFRKSVVAALARIWPNRDRLPKLIRLRSALQNLSFDPPTAYANTLALLQWGDAAGLLRNQKHYHELVSPVFSEIERNFGRGGDQLASMLAVDTSLMLPDDFLTKVDRASMAYGLEVRPPLVDHELLDLLATMPSQYKIRRQQPKWILKQLVEKRLPPAMLKRKKQGFEIPLNTWLRGPLQAQVRSYLQKPKANFATYINADQVHQLVDRFMQNHTNCGSMIWALLVLARWFESYAIDRSTANQKSVTTLACTI